MTTTWREALEYCRTFHTDLANVRDATENVNVKKIAKTDVWIGLFKDPWSWSDQSNSSFRFWNSSQLNNIRRDQDCVSVMVNQTGKWNDVKCNATQPFLCHSGALSSLYICSEILILIIIIFYELKTNKIVTFLVKLFKKKITIKL